MSPSFTLCNISLLSAIPIDQGEVSYLLSLLPLPFILLGDFNSENIPWGAVLANKRGRVLSDVCIGCNLLLLNTGANMHL
jgi:hypothetical protein